MCRLVHYPPLKSIMASCGSRVNIFKNLESNIKLVLSQIKDGECNRETKESFTSEKYWNYLETVFKTVSHEGTKLSFAFTKAPFPNFTECEAMASSMETVLLKLVSTYYSFPKSQGLTLQRTLQQSMLQILNSVLALVSCLAQSDPEAGSRQQATGIVWEGANNFSTIPQNNRDAVICKMDESSGLVEDALAEIDEILNNDGRCEDILGEEEDTEENIQSWTDQDRVIVAPIKGLMKTIIKVLKKGTETCRLKGHCDSSEQVAQMDGLSDYAQQLSPAVDNLISCLYAPVDHTVVKNNATALSDLVEKLLNILRNSHMTDEAEDSKWLDFLRKANEHNISTLVHALIK